MADVESTPVWETSKENAQPLRKGRKVSVLNECLTPGAGAGESHEARRQQFEEGLKASTHSDPLALWCDYVKWLQDTYVTGGSGSHLLPVLERCAHTFKDDGRYVDDPRYLRIWVSYADMVIDAEPIFDYLYDRRIGQEHTLFYESWAAVLEGKKKMSEADKVYQRGLLMKAKPLQRLERAHQQFQHRLVKRIMSQPDPAEPSLHTSAQAAPRPNKERKALNRLKKSEAVPGVSRPTKERPAGTMRPAIPAAPAETVAAGNFTIFVDPALKSSEDDEPQGAWETGTSTENKKENSGLVEPWAGVTMPQQKRARAGAAACAPFTIHTDKELVAPEEELETAVEPVNIRLQLDGPAIRTSQHLDQMQHNPLSRFDVREVAPVVEAPRRARNDENSSASSSQGSITNVQTSSGQAGTTSKQRVMGFNRSLLEHAGLESTFEEARARAQHGYGSSTSSGSSTLHSEATCSRPSESASRSIDDYSHHGQDGAHCSSTFASSHKSSLGPVTSFSVYEDPPAPPLKLRPNAPSDSFQKSVDVGMAPMPPEGASSGFSIYEDVPEAHHPPAAARNFQIFEDVQEPHVASPAAAHVKYNTVKSGFNVTELPASQKTGFSTRKKERSPPTVFHPPATASEFRIYQDEFAPISNASAPCAEPLGTSFEIYQDAPSPSPPAAASDFSIYEDVPQPSLKNSRLEKCESSLPASSLSSSTALGQHAATAGFSIYEDSPAPPASLSPAACSKPSIRDGFSIYADGSASSRVDEVPAAAAFEIYNDQTDVVKKTTPLSDISQGQFKHSLHEHEPRASEQSGTDDASQTIAGNDEDITINTKAALSMLMPSFSEDIEDDGVMSDSVVSDFHTHYMPSPQQMSTPLVPSRRAESRTTPVFSAGRQPLSAHKTCGMVPISADKRIPVFQDTPRPSQRKGLSVCEDTPRPQPRKGLAVSQDTPRPQERKALAVYADTPRPAGRAVGLPVDTPVISRQTANPYVITPTATTCAPSAPTAGASPLEDMPSPTENYKAAWAAMQDCFKGDINSPASADSSDKLTAAPLSTSSSDDHLIDNSASALSRQHTSNSNSSNEPIISSVHESAGAHPVCDDQVLAEQLQDCDLTSDDNPVTCRGLLRFLAKPSASTIELQAEPIDPFEWSQQRQLLHKVLPNLRALPNFFEEQLDLAPPARLARGDTIALRGERFRIRSMLGNGSFAKVLCVHKDNDETSAQRSFAAKLATPSNSWEAHIHNELSSRIRADDRHRVLEVLEAHIFGPIDSSKSSSILLQPVVNGVTLQELVNLARTANRPIEEPLAIFYTSELLRTLHVIHESGVIHADVKPDNVMIQCADPSVIDVTVSMSDPASGWTDQCPVLLDFGRAIDLRLYPKKTRFSSSVMADAFECREMREGRPWTFQIDSFAAAASAHFLLHSDYMEVMSTSSGWRPHAPLRRYWQTDMWNNFFDVLLNVPVDGPQPNLLELANEMTSALDNLPMRQKLRHALQSQYASLREAGVLKHRIYQGGYGESSKR